MDLRVLDELASGQHGLVTRAQAKKLGVSNGSWYRALEAWVLMAVHPNVARTRGSPTTVPQAAMAAVLAAGSGALASHWTAAWLWGIPCRTPEIVDLLLPTRTRGLRLVGVAVHRPRDRQDLKAVRRDGVPTTNILRTWCDLGAHDPDGVPGAVGHVITTRLARPDTLLRAVIRHSEHGRAGVPALREALQEWDIAGKPADSVLEPAMHRLARDRGLPPVEFHARLGRYEVDFLVSGSCVVVECDGWGPHVLDRANWERDRARDADLAALGYVVLRVTYRDITRRAAATAGRIRAALVRWAPHLIA